MIQLGAIKNLRFCTPLTTPLVVWIKMALLGNKEISLMINFLSARPLSVYGVVRSGICRNEAVILYTLSWV